MTCCVNCCAVYKFQGLRVPCIINSSMKSLSPGQPENREEWVSVRRFESLIYWGELHIYIACSIASYKAVVSKFIVCQARPQQIPPFFFQFKVTNFACANWQMRLLSCITCSLVPSSSPQLSSLAVRITLLTVICTASDDSCGEGLGIRTASDDSCGEGLGIRTASDDSCGEGLGTKLASFPGSPFRILSSSFGETESDLWHAVRNKNPKLTSRPVSLHVDL